MTDDEMKEKARILTEKIQLVFIDEFPELLSDQKMHVSTMNIILDSLITSICASVCSIYYRLDQRLFLLERIHMALNDTIHGITEYEGKLN